VTTICTLPALRGGRAVRDDATVKEPR
jgi:hypothetical protein